MRCFSVDSSSVCCLIGLGQVDEAEVKVAEVEGEPVDNQMRLDVVTQQEELIKSEAEQLQKEKEKEVCCVCCFLFVLCGVCAFQLSGSPPKGTCHSFFLCTLACFQGIFSKFDV